MSWKSRAEARERREAHEPVTPRYEPTDEEIARWAAFDERWARIRAAVTLSRAPYVHDPMQSRGPLKADERD